MTKKVKLGSQYEDKLHGICGTATARSEYMTGCTRVLLEYVRDGKIVEHWFDEPQLLLFNAKKFKPVKGKDRGGPGIVAPSMDCPTR